MKYFFGILCQVAAGAVALAGLIPLAALLNPWRSAKLASQLDEIYFAENLTRAGVMALLASAMAYFLLRFGTHLKSSPSG